jgi:hypothetical protein
MKPCRICRVFLYYRIVEDEIRLGFEGQANGQEGGALLFKAYLVAL